MHVREPEPGDRIGPYLLERKLGEGGMGLVFEAVDTRGDAHQRVAVKVLKPEAADERLELARFEREARLAAQLTSPNIVRVTDAGVAANGLPYIVMELVPARDLAHELRAGRVPAPGEMVTWARQVLDALAEAHRLGIIHRDVKPSNILIERRDGVARAKLADFGISKDLGAARLTETGMFVGTPRYMAPEQITSPREIDGRVDVWAVGVVLYEYFAGESPFLGATAVDIVANVLTTDPKPLERIPSALASTIMQTLEKERERRPRTAEELSARLAPFAVVGEAVDPLAPTLTVEGMSRGTPSSGGSRGSRGSHGSKRSRKRRSNKLLFALAATGGAGLAAGAIALALPLVTPESKLAPVTVGGTKPSATPTVETPPLEAPSAGLPARGGGLGDASAPSASVIPPTTSTATATPPPSARGRALAGVRSMTLAAANAWVQANRVGLDACFGAVSCDYAYNVTMSAHGLPTVGGGTCTPGTEFYGCIARLVDAHPLQPSCNPGHTDCVMMLAIPAKY